MPSTSKTLIMTVGLPRSGKSGWAKSTGFPIVSPDSIRLSLHGQPHAPLAEPMVWVIARIMVKALFLSGHDTVVLDTGNINKYLRSRWKSKEWQRRYQQFDTPGEECIRRAKANGQIELAKAIEKMKVEPLEEDEYDG